MCFLWGTNWILIYYWDELRPTRADWDWYCSVCFSQCLSSVNLAATDGLYWAKLRIRKADVETSTCSDGSLVWVPVLARDSRCSRRLRRITLLFIVPFFVSCLLVRVKRDMKVHVLVSVLHFIAIHCLLVLSAFPRAFLHMNLYAIDIYRRLLNSILFSQRLSWS
jgi:hypothetical protein